MRKNKFKGVSVFQSNKTEKEKHRLLVNILLCLDSNFNPLPYIDEEYVSSNKKIQQKISELLLDHDDIIANKLSYKQIRDAGLGYLLQKFSA